MSCYHEILVTLQLHEDIPVVEVQSALSELVNSSMLFNAELKELHHRNEFKQYTFCLPYPLEPDRLYRRGRLYCFHLRTTSLKLALAFRQCLPQAKGLAKVVSVELKNYEQRLISELTTLTPVVCTVDNRCWLPENGLPLLAERLQGNALKKCKQLDPVFAMPEGEDFFFEHIQMKNHKPIKINYKRKETTLLGHKLHLSIKPHPWAQQLAFTVLGEGLLEKNTLGFGYCIAGSIGR